MYNSIYLFHNLRNHFGNKLDLFLDIWNFQARCTHNVRVVYLGNRSLLHRLVRSRGNQLSRCKRNRSRSEICRKQKNAKEIILRVLFLGENKLCKKNFLSKCLYSRGQKPTLHLLAQWSSILGPRTGTGS